jgi:chromosome segregation ATPase
VEDQPSASVSPSAVLSILGKYLDNFVLRLMDLKKISESLSVSVPAMKTDCDRLMSKILDLERLRAEWSESQGELMQAKSALASQMKQQQSHNQTEAHVLSVLQSCGGVVQGEQLAQAAVRITEELKTARMTVSELARQVEVERSSSSSRNRVADSHGSELRASLAAAEQRHAAELSATKSQLRKSELQCQQVQLELQAVTKLNAELNEQVNVFESVLAEKDAEVVEVSQQLQLARALVTSLSEQTEAAVNLELVSLIK